MTRFSARSSVDVGDVVVSFTPILGDLVDLRTSTYKNVRPRRFSGRSLQTAGTKAAVREIEFQVARLTPSVAHSYSRLPGVNLPPFLVPSPFPSTPPHILVADERREYGRLIWNYRSLWNYGTFRLSSFSSFSSSSSFARQSNFAAFVEIPRDDRSALSALLTPSRPFFPPAFHFAILRNWVARGNIANNEVTKAKTM